MAEIIRKAEEYVCELLKQLDTRYCYHDLEHTLRVKQAVEELSTAARLAPTEREVLLLAALFHDTGFTEVYHGHEQVSCRIAREFLQEQSYPSNQTEQVISCIEVTEMNATPDNRLEMLMKDADLSNLGQEDYLKYLARLRCEWEDVLHKKHSDAEWYALNHHFLKSHRYYTPTANSLYGHQFEANQKHLKQMAKESKESLKKGIKGSRSAQMMFKTALRNHLDLSNLADNKANIMLSVNALIITIAMPVAATYIASLPYLLPPAILLLCTCLASMIFATLATRPIKMTGYTPADVIERGDSNLFFFGNFFRMSLREYQDGMAKIVDNEERLEGSIMRDLYYLGHSLGRKYHQLRICYNIFMLGIIMAVVVFAISYFIYT
jgi:predicted metal-dependent HD superfamily phosphohydrolase